MQYPFLFSVVRSAFRQKCSLHSFPAACLELIKAIVIVLAFSTAGLSATYVVTKTADTNDGVCDSDCSLREAIAAANATGENDQIDFDPAVFSSLSTIALAFGDLQIQNSGNLNINGPGKAFLTIDGLHQYRIFTLADGVNLKISGMTLTKGAPRGLTGPVGGGAIYNSTGTLRIEDSLINLCGATGGRNGANGGAVFNRGTLEIVATEFNLNYSDNNTSSGGSGGAIFNQINSSMTISLSTFSQNTAGDNDGGAIFNREGVVSNIADSLFVGNNSRHGGAIFGSGDGELTIANSTFTNNTCQVVSNSGDGGAIRTLAGVLSVQGSSFTQNIATRGGAIYSFGGNVLVVGSMFNENSATSGSGGALHVVSDTTIVDSEMTANSAMAGGDFNGGAGGGIHNAGILLMQSSTISQNTAGRGGGLSNNGGTVTIERSTIHSNNAQTAGGICSGCNVFDTTSGAVNVTNTTIYGNNATTLTSVGGGAIVNSNFNSLVFSYSTIANNTGRIAAGIYNQSGSIRAVGSIFSGNISSDGSQQDYFGTLQSDGFNIIRSPTNLTLTGSTIGVILGQDPQLLPLGSYGGPRKTVALMPTSPALDAGDPLNFPATDQRGVPRSQDGDLDGTLLPDIGAYERQVTQFVVTNTTDESGETCDSNCSLREAISAAVVATTPDNAVVFEPSVFGVFNEIILSNGEIVVPNNNGTLIVKGPGSELLSISGNNLSRIFAFRTNSNSAVIDVAIQNGNGSGAFNNGFGGAVYFDGRSLVLQRIVAMANSATQGGAIYSQSGTLEVEDSRFESNSASGNGGAFLNQSNGKLFVRNTTVTGNSNPSTGGIDNHGLMTLTQSTISGNNGRGVMNSGTGTATIHGSVISHNTLNNNDGGGIYNFGNIIVRASTISNNRVSDISQGGGMYNSGNATLVNSTLSGNQAGAGGGIENVVGVLNLTNVTIAGNRANSCCGGGIGGGGVRNSSATTNVKNSLIAKNISANNGVAPDFQGVLVSQGFNLIENTNGTSISGITTGNILDVDALIDPLLRENGGLTPTHSLRLNSPAIDKGAFDESAANLDQRNLARPFDFPGVPNASGGNGSDIGAFERQPSDVVPETLFDMDGDGKTDVSVFRPLGGSGSEWWYLRSSDGGNRAFAFGEATDTIVPADFTGDGKTDLAFWRPASGEWFVLRSEDSTFFAFPFGASGDIPAPADYDGDGKSDATVYRPSTNTWFTLRSSDGQVAATPFGTVGDKPVPADYDGDGKADVAIFRPTGGSGGSEWWYLRSSDGANRAFAFGSATDLTVPGDYTGDGKADLAYFRPSIGEWYVLRSEDSSFFAFPWGASGDVPAPGDYDGDGKIDAAVFRPSNSNWFALRSTAGPLILQFGTTGDRPLPNAFVR